jgi:hypothetical protein
MRFVRRAHKTEIFNIYDLKFLKDAPFINVETEFRPWGSNNGHVESEAWATMLGWKHVSDMNWPYIIIRRADGASVLQQK